MQAILRIKSMKRMHPLNKLIRFIISDNKKFLYIKFK